MHITEESSEFHITPPVLLCDTPLSDLIPKILPNKHHFLCIVGSPGSGKTSTMVSLLTSTGKNKAYRKVFENIYFVIPPNSRASLANKIFEKHDPDKIYDELTQETLQDIHEKIKHEASEGYNSLIVLDDVGASLKNKANEEMLKKIIWNRRHLRTSIWSIQQTFTSLPLTIRKSISHIIMCGMPKNKKEYLSVFEELIHSPKEEADHIAQYVFKNKHDSMYISIEDNKIYRNYNLLHLTY
jgi:GTPase SAR1 family protein